MRLFGTVLAATVMLAAGTAQAAGNLISDGGFEQPHLPTGAYTYPGGAHDAWTYGGSALVNAEGGSAWYGVSAPAGQEGGQFAALQATSSLSQSFTATASTLLLSWLDAGRPFFGGYDGDQTYSVKIDGTTVGTYSTTSGQAFTAQNLTLGGFTAGTTHTLTFQGLVSKDETAFIDKVSLVAGVPEPATWGLMILGFAAIGLTLRGERRVASST